MILLAAIVIALGVGFVRGGNLSGLGRMPLRRMGFAVIAFALQTVFIYRSSESKAAGVWGWQEALFIGSHALLAVALWANRHMAGIRWIALGMLLNLIVMVANGGWMPITPEAVVQVGHTSLVPMLQTGMRIYSSKDILLPRDATHLWWLSDVFVLARPFPIPSVFSIGDVAVALGAFLLIQQGMLVNRGR